MLPSEGMVTTGQVRSKQSQGVVTIGKVRGGGCGGGGNKGRGVVTDGIDNWLSQADSNKVRG